MSNLIESDQPCPCGQSSDAYALYDDGHGFCFSCNKAYNNGVETIGDVTYDYKPQRGLTKGTCEFYDILTKSIDGNEVAIGFTHSNGAVKLRNFTEDKRKRYVWVKNERGDVGRGLYGANLFQPASLPSVTITEGHADAASIYQATGRQTAGVSVQSASSAVRDVRDDFEFVNSFDKVVVAFDNDQSGQRAAAQVAALFDPNKVFNLRLEKYKDANEYLIKGETRELTHEWINAKKYTPDSFIHTFPEIRRSLTESRQDIIGSYPLPYLQTSLRGLLRGELVVFKGLEGIGKTEFFRAVEYHCLKHHPDLKLGLIHMEEDKATTIRGIATYEAGYPMYFTEDGTTEEEVFEAYKRAVGDKDDRVYIYKIRVHDDPDEILTSIRAICVTSGVDVIFLDNLNKLVETIDEDSERRKLVYLAAKLKSLATDLNICIPIIAHVNDDGKALGSRYTTKVADKVVHMHRDMKSTDPIERNTTYFFVEKGRLIRESDLPTGMVFDPGKYTLTTPE